MLPVVLSTPAQCEFKDAAEFYASHDPVLAAEFIQEIERCLSLIAKQPLAYPVVHNEVRRIITKRFPFAVYFLLETERIVVTAIFHSSRNPIKWHDRH